MTRQLVWTSVATGALMALVVLMPSTSHATRAWLGPEKITEEAHNAANSVHVAMDAKGDVAIVWVQRSGSTSWIDVAWRPAGATLSAPLPLSSTQPEASASSPTIAMDSRGDATIAWIEGLDPVSTVKAAWCPVGNMSCMPASDLWEVSGMIPTDPLAAMDSKGDTTVAWENDNSGFGEVFAASRRTTAGFEDIRSVSTFSNESAEAPAIAVDPEGDVTLAWSDFPLGAPLPFLIQTATQPVGASFGPPTGFALNVYRPTLAMGSNGETTMVWSRRENATNIIEASTRPHLDASFETPVVLASLPSAENENPIRSDVAMDAAGDTVVAWASDGIMSMEMRPAGASSFGPPIELLKDSGFAESLPAVAMDERGDGVVAWWWKTEPSEAHTLLGSTMPAGGTFGVPAYVPASGIVYGETPTAPVSLAIDSRGDVASAWVSSYNGTDTIQLAGYQAGGPWLEGLQVPSTGEMNTALSFSISPVSVWSTVSATTWSWGDGSPETMGAGVTHVFDKPGTYEVTVKASDALGNVTQATRSVTVEEALTGGHAGSTAGTSVSVASLSPKPEPAPLKRRTTSSTPVALVSRFTPLFATRASITGNSLGLLVGIPAVKGARKGDTVVVRCTAGCARPLSKVLRVRGDRNDAHATVAISPPLALRGATRIEIELQAPGHIGRFTLYRFVKTTNEVIAHVVRRGCISAAGTRERCR